jgi:hypothetical protein
MYMGVDFQCSTFFAIQHDVRSKCLVELDCDWKDFQVVNRRNVTNSKKCLQHGNYCVPLRKKKLPLF